MKKTLSLIFLNYVRLLAKVQIVKVKLLLKLRGQKLQIIGITGSAGKTSTLLTLEACLKPNFSVKTNSGANSESGIPLNILGIKVTNFRTKDWLKYAFLAPLKLLFNWKTYQVYLVEMGIDEPEEPKDMSYLLKIIRPNIGIFLNVNPVHSEQFDHTVPESVKPPKRLQLILENIGKEKAKLINSLPPTGTAIVNLDDPIVSKTTISAPAQKLTFSKQSGATLKIIKTETDSSGFQLTFSTQNQRFLVKLPNSVLPEIYSTSIAASILASQSLGINIKTAIRNLESNLKLPPGRSNLLLGIRETRIIDSSYNSSPQACLEMLNLLSKFPKTKIAVLGDMRELGQQSPEAHKTIFNTALKTADLVISVGPETQKYFTEQPNVHKFLYWWQAAHFLKTKLQGSETILVKGSQNTIYLEELVKSLLQNESDSQKLCRQSPYWIKTKNKFRRQHSQQ